MTTNKELFPLIDEYNIAMENKRMLARVCLAYGLSMSEDAKDAFNRYDAALEKCKRLARRINEKAGEQLINIGR